MARRRTIPPLITRDVAESILDGRRRVSLDLGLTTSLVSVEDSFASLPDGSQVGFEDLTKIMKHEDVVFFPKGEEIFMVAVSDGHYYRLVPTEAAPTLEVDGVRMHRTKGTTPDADAARKVEALRIRGGRVLDTCTGLGYTSIFSAEKGADLIVSVELRAEVLRIAEMNPWSRKLFEDVRIHPLLGDSFSVLDALPHGFFDYAIHDPPRFALAGQLYGGAFYAKLFGVLKARGRLFHYTGEPGSKYRGIDLRKGVMNRLREAGFSNISYHPEVLGITCEKPSG